MGLKSFYLAVNCHFFFAGAPPRTPRWGPRRPPDPRVRPCSASRSPKRQVRLSAEVTSGRPTSKKTAMYGVSHILLDRRSVLSSIGAEMVIFFFFLKSESASIGYTT